MMCLLEMFWYPFVGIMFLIEEIQFSRSQKPVVSPEAAVCIKLILVISS